VAYIKVEADNAQQMMLGVAKAYGYYEPKNAPLWWDSFWQWYLAYVALTRESRLVGTFVDTDPWQAMTWFMARALMESNYVEDDALDDMREIDWFRDAEEEFNTQVLNSPDNRNEVAIIVVEIGDAEKNPWRQMAREAVDTVKVDLGKIEPKDSDSDKPIDFNAERQKMAQEEKPEQDIKFPHTGVIHNDPKMTPEHRAALAMPGDKVDMHEPMPAKCLMGAPGSKLDDDKLYPKDAWCAARGPNTPPSPTGRVAEPAEPKLQNAPPLAPSQPFGAVPAPSRPAQHPKIEEPEDERPVEERLAEAQPGDHISVVEPPPEKCLFGAPSVLPDDDVIHADSAFCSSSAPVSSDDGDDEDEDEGNDYYGDDDDGDDEPWPDTDDGLDPEETETPDPDVEPTAEAVEVDGHVETNELGENDQSPVTSNGAGGLSEPRLEQREAEFSERLTPPTVVDDSVELDRVVESTTPTDTPNANGDVLTQPSAEALAGAEAAIEEAVNTPFIEPAPDVPPADGAATDPGIDDNEETKTDLPRTEDGFEVDYDEGDEQPQ